MDRHFVRLALAYIAFSSSRPFLIGLTSSTAGLPHDHRRAYCPDQRLAICTFHAARRMPLTRPPAAPSFLCRVGALISRASGMQNIPKLGYITSAALCDSETHQAKTRQGWTREALMWNSGKRSRNHLNPEPMVTFQGQGILKIVLCVSLHL